METKSIKDAMAAKLMSAIIAYTIVLIFGSIVILAVGQSLTLGALFGSSDKQIYMQLGFAVFSEAYLILIYPICYIILVPLTVTLYNLKKYKPLTPLIALMWILNIIAIILLVGIIV